MSQLIQQKALTRLLVEKRIFTREELLEMVKVVDREMKRERERGRKHEKDSSRTEVERTGGKKKGKRSLQKIEGIVFEKPKTKNVLMQDLTPNSFVLH